MVHFIERLLYPLNFRSEFSRLVLDCSKSPIEKEFRQTKGPAIVYDNNLQDLCDFIHSDDEKYLVVESILKHGFEVAAKYVPLPKAEVFDAIKKFKSVGFKTNGPIFKKRENEKKSLA